MTTVSVGSLCLVLSLGTSALAQQKEPAALRAKEIKLGECKVYVHSSSSTLICIHGEDRYYGTPGHVTPFVRGEQTHKTADDGLCIKYTDAKSDGKSGLLMYCAGGDRFYAPVDDAAWSKMSKGKDTVSPICWSGVDKCPHEPAASAWPVKWSGSAAKSTSPTASGTAAKTTKKSNGNVIQAGGQYPAAPGITLIEGERVRPDEAMIFTRSMLVEEGPSVAAMNNVPENINNVRYNMNSYRLGYALPAVKNGDRYQFSGAVKCWRATSTGDVSSWPSSEYRASRDEAIRRAKLLQPISIAEEVPEMANLRVYYLPSLVGHDGRRYQTVHQVMAFLVHPNTGYRMTVMMRDGRTFGTVNKPLAVTSHIYVQDTETQQKGPFGLVRIHIPSVFYTKKADFDMEPFAAGDTFERMMNTVLQGHLNGPLATDDFKALYDEMSRYTGGKPE